MGTEKGLFQDLDKYTQAHQALALWFVPEENIKGFLRYALGHAPANIRAEFEVPVTDKKGFIYGFADVVIYFQTVEGRQEAILIELKSSFSDFGEVLRQIKTYQEFLSRRPIKTYLIHPSPTQPLCAREARSYFKSQGVMLLSMPELEGGIKEASCRQSRAPECAPPETPRTTNQAKAAQGQVPKVSCPSLGERFSKRVSMVLVVFILLSSFLFLFAVLRGR
jgi:hypothetical protein